MSVNDEIRDIVGMMREVRKSRFFQLVSYLQEKDSEDRTFARVRREFPEVFNDVKTFESLIEHRIIWIDMDGTLRLGRLAQELYTVASDIIEWIE
ncbi:MAG: hypothetical protein ACE5Z5_02130 [Candidatus Bathyarchaeia archaeon]